MKITKRGLALLLSLLMIISVLPSYAFAYDYVEGSDQIESAPLITKALTDIDSTNTDYFFVYYKFIPTESTTYTIGSISSGDPACSLLDDTQAEIAYDHDSGSGDNFQIVQYLTADKTYYLKIFDEYMTPNATLSITGGGLYDPFSVPTPTQLNISLGNIAISSGGASGGGLSTPETALNTAGYVITGTSNTNKVTVNGVTTSITAKNLNINVSANANSSAFALTGSANVTLILDGTNKLASGYSMAGLQVSSGQWLTIQGTGSLEAVGGTQGAGIGGGLSQAGGTITVSGGSVTAKGGIGGAGIGGGLMGGGGTIGLLGGNIMAFGGNPDGNSQGSGIGGGATVVGDPANITISSNANVTAVAYGTFRPAIHAIDNLLNSNSTAKVLMANFTDFQTDESTQIFPQGSETPIKTFEPSYQSIAMTAPAGTYKLKTGGVSQMHSNGGFPSMDFAVSATGLSIFNDVTDFVEPPEINVKGNAISIANGDMSPDLSDYTDFGEADISNGVVTRTFTIENTGASTLNLTSPSPYITNTGSGASDFTITQIPNNQISAGTSTSFAITFDPTAAGTRAATVNIANNDSNENPYTFAIKGIGYELAAVSSVTAPSNGIYTEGDNLNFTVNFSRNVTVTGTPYIPIDVGESTVNATYVSGSSTSNIVFRYTVQDGQLDTDGIKIDSSVVLNGGNITDPSGKSVILNLNNVYSTAGVLVNGIKYSVQYQPGTKGTFTEQVTSNLSYGAATPDAPTVTGNPGYEFTGWSPAVSDTVTGNATYVAQWTPQNQTLVYNSFGGLGIMNSKLAPTDNIINLDKNTYTKAGYTFIGWSTAEGGSVEYNDEGLFTMPAGGKTLYAVWQEETNVTINYAAGNGGTVDIESESLPPVTGIAQGATATAYLGYHFVNWTKDGVEVSKNANFVPEKAGGVNVASTYTANFAPNSNTAYKVEHYTENLDGSWTLADTDFLTGTTNAIATAILRTFAGFTAPTTAPSAVINGDASTVIRVEYIRNSYEISFDSNGGTPIGYITQKYEELIVPPAEPTKTGHEFLGWYKDAAGLTDTWDFALDKVTGTITLLAKWKAKTYTITYHLDGGTEGVNIPVSYTYGIGATLVAPTKIGNNFGGWYDNSGCTGAPVTAITQTDTGNKEYWAKWNINSYTVSFDSRGGSTINAISANYDSIISEPINPTKSGYKFDGWYKESVCENAWIFTEDKVTESIILYAKWTANIYTITYNINGGTNDAANPLSYTIESPAINLANPTKTGYTFSGWTEGNTIPTGSMGDKTFTATWTADTYTITYNLDGGTNDAANPLSYTIESPAIILANPTKTGYTFSGWTEGSTIPTGSTGDKTFTATWTVNSYTIKYNLDGGTAGTDSPEGYTYGVGTALVAPTKTGYNFAGWYDNSGCTGAPVTAIPVTDTGNKEYWAKWVEKSTVSINQTVQHAVYDGVNKGFAIVGTPTDNFTITYNQGSGNVQPLNAGTYNVVVSRPEDDTFKAFSITIPGGLVIDKAVPTVAFPTASDITYGTALYDSMLTGGTITLGSFAWTNGSVIPTVANSGYSVTFTPNDLNNYNYTTAEGWVSESNVIRRTVAVAAHKAPLTVTAKNNTIVYGAIPSGNGVTYSGFVNGENENVLKGTLDWSFDYNQFDTVGKYSIIPMGLTADNYEISFDNGELTVDKATVTPNAKTFYITLGGTKDFSVPLNDLLAALTNGSYGDIEYSLGNVTDSDGIFEGDASIDTDLLKFTKAENATLEVGNSATVEILITTTNYIVSNATITVEITDKDSINISGINVVSRAYDGTPIVPNGIAIVTDSHTNAVGDYLPLIYTYTGTSNNGTPYESELPPTLAGAYTLNIKTDTDDDKYIGEININFEIQKKAPTLTFPTAENVTYGTLLSETEFSGGSGTGGGTFAWSDLSIRPTVTNNGYDMVFTPVDPYNYDYSSTALTTRKVIVTVAPKEATLLWANFAARTYNGVASNVTASVSNLEPNDDCTITVTGGDALNAGNYTAIAESLSNNNYVLPAAKSQQYTVNKATPQAIVFPTAEDITYGDNLLDVSLSAGSGDGTFAWTDSAIMPTVINSGYSVTFTPRDTANFDYTGITQTSFVPITVSPKVLTITATAENKVYDKTDSATVVFNDDRITGDNLTISAAASFDTKDAGTGKFVTVSSIAVSGSSASNYTWNQTCGAKANIIPKDVTVTADNKTKAEGEADPEFTYSQVGLIDGDTLSGNLVREKGEGLGAYRILSMLTNPNYVITYIGNTLAITGGTSPVEEPTGAISGMVTDNSTSGLPITVSVEIGNKAVASVIASLAGEFSFNNMQDGIYNLVADNGQYKVTTIAELKNGQLIQNGMPVMNITMTIGKTQSVVEIANESTPDMVVGGLERWFGTSDYSDEDKNMVGNGGTVEIKFIAENKQETDIEVDAKAIKAVAGSKAMSLYVDLSVIKTVIDNEGITQSSNMLSQLCENIQITIPISEELQGKKGLCVYRLHNGKAEVISSDVTKEEYFVVGEKYITLYVKQFSMYAVGYSRPSGGSSYVSVPSLNVNSANVIKQTVVTLKPSQTNSVIYYTLDGTTPTASSAKYEKPIILKKDTIIKYFEVGSKTSSIVSRDIKVSLNAVEFIKNASETRYVKAVSDTEFAPDKVITRYDVVKSLFNILGFEEGTVDTELSDVKDDMKQIVAYFQSANIIDGFEDSTFKGEQGLTRAEFVKIMAVIIGLDVKDQKSAFGDVNGHWAEQYIAEFTKMGYIKGYEDGSFKPDQMMTRAEFVAIVNRIIKTKSVMVPPVFNDLTSGHWAYGDIMAIYKR